MGKRRIKRTKGIEHASQEIMNILNGKNNYKYRDILERDFIKGDVRNVTSL